MRLKSLELVGFKSFLDPTLITFAPGITAVVGPNGCGKSNVVDAIRWVLGEQAPSRLRGKSTEDLIYIGNDAHPAAGMAEVTLTLEADDERALPEPYTTLSEVSVTRRVYRSGDSEYLINKIPCRLKDITEFFMAAQIHSRGYALIEQGRIEEIIQAKPEEVRGLIEEAAGLALFKGRREMSERKLERVKENLARLDDVLSEIERQLNFARRQAKKAEAYKQIRQELVGLERFSAARRLLEHREELAANSARENELKREIEAARARVAELQADADRLTAELQARREQSARSSRELENLRAAMAERERTRAFLERRAAAIDELVPSLTERLRELEEKATSARALRAEAGARLAREHNQDDGGEADLRALKTRHDEAGAELNARESNAEELKDELSDLIREAAVARGRLADLAAERTEIEEKIRLGEAEAPSHADAKARAERELREAEASLASLREELTNLEAAAHEAARGEIQTRAALEQVAARSASLRRALATAHTRTESPSQNGAGERLRTILESLNGDRPAVAPSFLFDVIKAPAELRPALTAVLGDEAEAVIVDSPEFALRAIEILKQKESGRLSFIPESELAPVRHAIDAPGIVGRLVDLVSVEPRFADVAEAILGHVIVAEDLSSAIAASNLNGHGAMFVTREGDLVHPGRMISGGSAETSANGSGNGHASHGGLAEDLPASETEERALTMRLEELRAKRGRLESAVSELRTRVTEAERTLLERRSELAQAEQRLATAESKRSDSSRRLVEIGDAIASANAKLEELAAAERDMRERLAAMRGEIAAMKAQVEERGNAMLEAASRFESRKAQFDALESELRRLSELRSGLEAQIDEHRATLARSVEERSEFERELAKLASQDEQGRSRQAELEAQVGALAEGVDASERALEAAASELEAAREALASLEAEAVECGLKRERARTLAEELSRAFAEKFKLDFDSVAADLSGQLEERDAAQDEQRLIELRSRAERIGEVNLAADGEVKELEERANALNAQREDLQNAVKDLTGTITKLNREARKRFAETFEGAAKYFSELFPKLMRGGKARLELAQADDVLEAGVNIMVQPAGKKVKEIGLLSGGEKALSAMALVFSLFLLNPSPFCVLDEVDAPLDEFSLAAFTSLVKELKGRSQFIIITHNQRTMQAADQIHGVTMDRPGVSRIISLRIPAAA
jgi:chromosome segregation protein